MAPNTPKTHYSPDKRTRIARDYAKGLTAAAVAARHGVSPASVYQIARRYRLQTSGQSLPRSGRPPALNHYQKRRILRLIEANPSISNTEIVAQLELPCCVRTLARFLKSEGIRQ